MLRLKKFATKETALPFKMYPEVTITIGRSYWRCLTCRTFSRRAMSIDQHVQVMHADLQPVSNRNLTSKLVSHEAESYSDSEIDNICSHEQAGFTSSGDAVDPLLCTLPSVQLRAGWCTHEHVKETDPLNPLMCTTPSAQLRGGRCAHNRVRLSGGCHGLDRVKTLQMKSTDLKDSTSAESIAGSRPQFLNVTSVVATENRSLQSEARTCTQSFQCVKTAPHKKYTKRKYQQATTKHGKKMAVNLRNPVTEQIFELPYRRLRSRCEQKGFHEDNNTSSVLAKESLQTDALTTPSSEHAPTESISFTIDTERRKTDGSINPLMLTPPSAHSRRGWCKRKRINNSRAAFSSGNKISELPLSGRHREAKCSKPESSEFESAAVDFKGIANRRKQTCSSVLSMKTGTPMKSDSTDVKRLRPGRKASKRRRLSKNEKEMIKQKYVQSVNIKDYIQHSEHASHDQQDFPIEADEQTNDTRPAPVEAYEQTNDSSPTPVEADEQTSDTSPVQINPETDSIMQDLQFLNTMGLPASEDFGSLTAEHVEASANAQISYADLQTCSELVSTVSALEVHEHSLHTNMLTPVSPALPATQEDESHSGMKWMNKSQVNPFMLVPSSTQLHGGQGCEQKGVNDGSDLQTEQHVFLADASCVPSALHSTQAPRHGVREHARITQYSHACNGMSKAGVTEAQTLDFVDNLVKPTNTAFNINPLTPGGLCGQMPTETSRSRRVNPVIPSQHTPHVFECRICQAKFSSFENLSAHENKMLSLGAIKCKTCSKLFHGMHYLNLHIFGEHELAKQCICFECDAAFGSMEKLETHLHRHIQRQDCSLTQMRFHDCRICDKEILSGFSVMQSHYYARHKAYLCFDCYLRSDVVYFMDPVSAKDHRQAHENVCDVCSKHFSSTEQFIMHSFQHVNSEAEDGTGMVCEKCDRWCANNTVALLHDRWHKLERVREKRAKDAKAGFACLQCDKVYRSKRNLDRHSAHSHTKHRTFKFHCEFCGKGVDTKNFLQDHIALHHLGVKRYACEHCDLRFVCRPTLRRHVLREHAKDRQYRCEFCGECFCDKIKLDRHMFVHTGKARFMCEHCGKGFHTSSEFKNHMTVHAETRDFVCQSCGQDYKRKEHLRRHLKNCKSLHCKGKG